MTGRICTCGRRYILRRAMKLWETYDTDGNHLATHFMLSEALEDLKRHEERSDEHELEA